MAGLELIALSEESPIQHLVQAALKKTGTEVRQRAAVNHLETAIALAEKGMGAAILPSFAAASCRRYAVRTAQLLPAVDFDFCCITKLSREPSDTLDSFTALLVKTILEG